MRIKIGVIGLASVLTWLLLSNQSFAVNRLVFPNGSGNYANIQEAIDASSNGDTVLLADGTFTRRGNMDIRYYGKEIVVCSQSGNAEACTIDVGGEYNEIAERGFIFENNETNQSILRDLTIINGSADALCPGCEGGAIFIDTCSPSIINVICRDNYALEGAAIMCVRSSAVIESCQFINNLAFEGPGVGCLDSAIITLSYCRITGNHATQRGGGIYLESNCGVLLENCTVSHNTAVSGSGLASWESSFYVLNSIISFNDSGPSVYASSDSAIYAFAFSDIFGNSGGDWIDIISNQNGVNGNICGNPLYADTTNGNFHLTQNSPCINAGDPIAPHDPDGTVADMGTFYFNTTSISDNNALLPEQLSLKQNYPNPFNAQALIAYTQPKAGEIALEIYNLGGQIVDVLTSGYQPAGNNQIVWNASNLSSGVYFARLKSADYSESIKMVLLK